MYVNTYMKSINRYVLKKKLDENYVYRGLNVYKSLVIVSHNKNSKVECYYYKNYSRSWGGSGKGFFLIYYYYISQFNN